MTTKPNRAIALDAFAPNDVLTISREGMDSTPEIAAVAWSYTGAACRVAHLTCGLVAVDALQGALECGQLWLLAATGIIEKRSRLSDYSRLWLTFERLGAKLPEGPREEEHLVETSEGMRWFSAIRFDSGDISGALEVVERFIGSGVVCIASLDENKTSTIQSLVPSGWTKAAIHDRPPPVVVEAIVKAEGAVLYPLGRFDDPEAGYVAFAPPALAQSLYLANKDIES